MAPGDVIAFRGNNWFSRLVARAGGGGVSHVGLITWRAEGGHEPELCGSFGVRRDAARRRSRLTPKRAVEA